MRYQVKCVTPASTQWRKRQLKARSKEARTYNEKLHTLPARAGTNASEMHAAK